MSKLKGDIESLLKYYVERESEEEKRLIEDQKKCELKVCLSVHLSRQDTANEDKNPVTIHTKLIQIPKEKDTEENHFYIKSQTITHQTRMSPTHQYYDGQIISIETVVTKPHYNCESVFKTLIHRTKNGKRDQTQRSFTREILKCEQKSANNLHRCLSKSPDCDRKNCSHLNSPPKANDETVNPPNIVDSNRKSKIKKSFSFSKRKTNTVKKTVENNVKTINNPENLEPIKIPKKSIKKRLKDWMNKSSILVPNEPINPINITPNRKKSIVEMKRYISTEESEMEKEKPTNIMARISTNAKTKAFEIIKDGMLFIDEDEEENQLNVDENPDKGISLSESFRSFNFPDPQRSKPVNMFVDEVCKCEERKKETMIKYLLSKLYNGKVDEREIEKFDDESQHFTDCPIYSSLYPARRFMKKNSSTSSLDSFSVPPIAMGRSREGSIISINSEFQLDLVFENFKFLNEIHCPAETISYFIESKDYETYENGLLKVLDTKVSLENMILVFYLTRIIVKQIDDPTYEENEDIKRIMSFSERFLTKYYFEEISKHGDLDKFILHSESVD